jgi:hypothetical protein
MRLAVQDIRNFHKNMSMAALFLDVEKAFNGEGVGCRGDPFCCKSLRSNAELTCKLDPSQQRNKPLNTEAEEITVLGPLLYSR